MELTHNSNKGLMIAVIFTLGVGSGLLLYHLTNKMRSAHISPERCALRTGMRKLWAEHVLWTRCYIISAIEGLADLEATTERLLKNQDDIGNAIVPFYGADAGKKVAQLLREHILIAAEVVKAAKANDADALKKADEKWHVNAKEIAEFLSGANPNWKLQDLISMLNEHLSLTTQEATAHLKKQWKEEIGIFDKVFDQAMSMADDLTNGIAAQFPDRA